MIKLNLINKKIRTYVHKSISEKHALYGNGIKLGEQTRAGRGEMH